MAGVGPVGADRGGWSPVGLDDERIWRPSGRVPRRDRSIRYRSAVPVLIADRTPVLSSETLMELERATLRLRTVDARRVTGAAAIPLLRTESNASSKVEQIHIGQRYVARALAGLPVKQRSALEVAANVNVIREAVAAADGPISPTLFDTLHAMLLPDETWAGKPRQVQNWIGGSDHSPRGARFVPPAAERVPALLDDLAAFLRRADLPALAQAALAHAQFEVIHPYEDGNGRLGRALAHLVLRRRGVVVNGIAPISVAVLADRDRYFADLRAYERGQADRFVRQFARSGLTAADSASRLTDDLADISQQWSQLPVVAGARSHATVRRLVTDLVEYPVCTAAQVATRYGVSHEAARQALEALRHAEVLNRTTAARNLQVYEATDVFDAIENVERSIR